MVLPISLILFLTERVYAFILHQGLLSESNLSRCIGRELLPKLTIRLKAIQPYPYHPGLGARTLLNDFTVHPFTDMLLSRSGFPFR